MNETLLIDLLNRRPAMNAGLTEAYAHWNDEVHRVMGALSTTAANPAGAQQPAPSAAAVQTIPGVQWQCGPQASGFTAPQPTQAQAVAVPLTDREIELIDGMIQVQLDHASRCDAIANRSMADKQKGWDMERVALLQKFKAHGIKGGQHGTE